MSVRVLGLWSYLSLDIVNTCQYVHAQYKHLLSAAHAQYMLFLAAYAMCMSTVHAVYAFLQQIPSTMENVMKLYLQIDGAQSQVPKSHGWTPLR